jgi:hypothetical protein
MAKFLCECGATLHLGEIPCPFGFLIIPESTIDREYDNISAKTINELSKQMYQCSECGRIHIFWEDLKSEPRTFRPEEG